MEEFWDLLQIVAICVTIVVVLLIILLALPQSKFRSFLLETLGWTGTGVSAVGLVSPVDIFPDVIPILGQADDVGYIIFGIMCGILAYQQHRRRQNDTKTDQLRAPDQVSSRKS